MTRHGLTARKHPANDGASYTYGQVPTRTPRINHEAGRPPGAPKRRAPGERKGLLPRQKRSEAGPAGPA